MRCIIQVDASSAVVELQLAGDGDVVVDWGDNSDLEHLQLETILGKYTHFFDNETDSRTIRLYGNFNLKIWDMSTINGVVLPVEPLIVDEVVIKKNNIPLDGLFLFKDTYSIVMDNISISSLSPIQNMSLSYLELQEIDYISDKTLDEYLIYIAQHNNQRRNCTVTLDKMPSGVYQEPHKDSDGNYVITTGMEAIYVITHEDAWNEAGEWVFNICGTTYQYENSDIA